MASSLIKHKRITTTVAKAKALRTYVEPLITRSKEDTTHSRRVVFSYLQDKNAVSELFREVSTKILNRAGGYTRILRTGFRKGDAAEMCIIELVDYNTNMLAATKEVKKTTTRRSRRGGGKKAEEETPKAQTKTETPKIAEAKDTVIEDAVVVEEEVKENSSEVADNPETQETPPESSEGQDSSEVSQTAEAQDKKEE